MILDDEKVEKLKQIFRDNDVVFEKEELKSVLHQMYEYAKIAYEQFKINKKL